MKEMGLAPVSIKNSALSSPTVSQWVFFTCQFLFRFTFSLAASLLSLVFFLSFFSSVTSAFIVAFSPPSRSLSSSSPLSSSANRVILFSSKLPRCSFRTRRLWKWLKRIGRRAFISVALLLEQLRTRRRGESTAGCLEKAPKR